MEGTDQRPDSGGDLRDEADRTESHDPVAEVRAVRAREAAAGIPGLVGFALVVTAGPVRGLHWPLDDGIVEAGRHPDAYLLLDDVTVSRHHAEFEVTDDRLIVRDLGSTNGTYVNGSRAEEMELHAGDEVIIGRFHLVVTRT